MVPSFYLNAILTSSGLTTMKFFPFENDSERSMKVNSSMEQEQCS